MQQVIQKNSNWHLVDFHLSLIHKMTIYFTTPAFFHILRNVMDESWMIFYEFGKTSIFFSKVSIFFFSRWIRAFQLWLEEYDFSNQFWKVGKFAIKWEVFYQLKPNFYVNFFSNFEDQLTYCQKLSTWKLLYPKIISRSLIFQKIPG